MSSVFCASYELSAEAISSPSTRAAIVEISAMPSFTYDWMKTGGRSDFATWSEWSGSGEANGKNYAADN